MKIDSVCVLGGTGFVGYSLVARLSKAGMHVRVLTRRRERHRELLVLPQVDVVEADVHDPEALQRQFADRDAVINLIGILNESGHDGSGFRHMHVDLAKKVRLYAGDAGFVDAAFFLLPAAVFDVEVVELLPVNQGDTYLLALSGVDQHSFHSVRIPRCGRRRAP